MAPSTNAWAPASEFAIETRPNRCRPISWGPSSPALRRSPSTAGLTATRTNATHSTIRNGRRVEGLRDVILEHFSNLESVLEPEGQLRRSRQPWHAVRIRTPISFAGSLTGCRSPSGSKIARRHGCGAMICTRRPSIASCPRPNKPMTSGTSRLSTACTRSASVAAVSPARTATASWAMIGPQS